MSLILTHTSDRIGEIVFNRPEKLNAFDPPMLEEFSEALAVMAPDKDVSVIILRGEGRGFSSGYDIGSSAKYGGAAKAGGRPDVHADWTNIRDHIKRWLAVWNCPKPVIAQVHGPCMGGATMLALLCDLTMVAEDAIIGWPALPLGGGLLGPPNSWVIGPKKAKELSYIAGSRMSGSEAVTLGWANHAYPEHKLSQATALLAAKIAKTPLSLLSIKKRAHNRVLEMQGFTESVLMGADFDAIAHATEEYRDMKASIAEFGLRPMMDKFRST